MRRRSPVSTDHEGQARPQGSGYGVGAYKFSPSGISSLSNIGVSFIAFNPIRDLSGGVSQGPLALTGASPPGKSAKSRAKSSASHYFSDTFPAFLMSYAIVTNVCR
jgi:hypothetical protein